MEIIISYLNSIHPISPKLQDLIKSSLILKEFKKNSIILKEGRVSEFIFFIESGLVRAYYIKDDTEISSWFMKEGDIIISVKSFYTQSPATESLQALEDCILYGITYQDLQHIYHNFPEFNFIGRVLTEKYYMRCEDRIYSLRKQKGNKRYEILQQQDPDLLQRVSSKHISSYLGLNVETLSRLRRK